MKIKLKLRRLDSNARPPGYEPDELPTAPLRDKLLAPSHRIERRPSVGLGSLPQGCYHYTMTRKHVTFSWSYAEPVLVPVSVTAEPFIYSVRIRRTPLYR